MNLNNIGGQEGGQETWTVTVLLHKIFGEAPLRDKKEIALEI